MEITSSAFKDGDFIPAKYSKNGGDISPPLSFVDIPNDAKSLALVCHDPDAPIEGGFTHWVVWGISPEISEILEGTFPSESVQGLNDRQISGWTGPQPPSGTHRYIFYLYCLGANLDLSRNTMRSDLLTAIEGHIIETATLTGLYSA